MLDTNANSYSQPNIHQRQASRATLLMGSILVIDDDFGIREALTDVLSSMANGSIFTAANGHEALAIVQEKRHQLRLVLLDMNMPVMNGEQTYAKLKELAPEVTVIVSSSLSPAEVAHRLQTPTMPIILRKPYNVDALLRTIHIALAMG